jgi:hypothetical protein
MISACAVACRPCQRLSASAFPVVPSIRRPVFSGVIPRSDAETSGDVWPARPDWTGSFLLPALSGSCVVNPVHWRCRQS